MNTSRTGATQRFDFSMPPPGYSVSGRKTTKSNTPTNNATTKGTYYNTPNQIATRHQSAKTTPQSSYHQAPSHQGAKTTSQPPYHQAPSHQSAKTIQQPPYHQPLSHQSAKTTPQPAYHQPLSHQSAKTTQQSAYHQSPSHQSAKTTQQPSYHQAPSHQSAKTTSQPSYHQASSGSNQNKSSIKSSPTPPPQNAYLNPAYQQPPPPTKQQQQQQPPPSPAIDPRIYSLPPPPPPLPTEPYPGGGNMVAAPPPTAQFVYGPVYANYPMAAMPPAMAAAPPMSMSPMPGPMGAGQFYPQQHRQWQYTPYNRGGYYNNYQNDRKRKSLQEGGDQDFGRKNPKKKKKPLSQNVPTKRTWSMEDAKRAWVVERDFNKRHKSQHLIIKFPDLQLNRDIVSGFHPKIDTVYFQQPSTPRFCFVTLKDSAAMDEVIRELNKIRFGDGYLTAEPKKDREEEFNIGPEDIDPLNLYVGNLAQEITVDDVVKAYPKNKRIDIGFAKKIKFTRYAFVSFRTVDDAIEAFQNTHNTEMYSKSLIVRFRRLHGTVGLPGEPKPQNPHKKIEDNNPNDSNSCDPDSTTKDDSDPYKGILKEEQPDTYSYHSGSAGDDDEDDEEELRYSDSITNLVFNSLDPQVAARVKNEPEDHDDDDRRSIGGGEDLPEDKQHIPMLEAKPEPEHKPLIMKIKKEKQEAADDEDIAEGRRTDEEDFEFDDPLYGAFARAAILPNKENTD